MSDPMAARLTDRKAWVRLLYMILFGVVLYFAQILVGAIAVVQFLFRLFSAEPLDQLRHFGASLAAYAAEVIAFETFASEDLPWPFGPFPTRRAPSAGEMLPAEGYDDGG